MKQNAIFMAPMTTWSSNPDLTVSSDELNYYRERAHNVDYVVTACTFLQKNYQSFEGQFFAGSDEYLPSLGSLANAIHKGGAKAILQVHTPGRMISLEMQNKLGIDIVSSSPIRPEREGYKTPRELKPEEIKSIVKSYYEVTIRAIKAGFDGIEIHGANTYLPQQFISPLTNRRSDAYGLDRLLFVKELIEAVERARDDAKAHQFIIGYRFSPEEREEGGLRLEHTFTLLDFLCHSGVNYLHVSLESFDRKSYFDNTVIATSLLEKIAGRKPLVGVGKIRNKEDVESALKLGYDHVAIGTALLLNPNWIDTAKPIVEITEESIPEDIPPAMRTILLDVFSKF
ncbi:oxidoreductase [Klebsiella aerogenes]|uniref:oxidoreductase n=1 Tax=Klebsiella aerogenes TaxID=548 RepID=UPI000693D362|nr:hypothetical protein [Klebsiella aerogenes]